MPVKSIGLPGGIGSPTGRIPHDRSRVAVKRSGVTVDGLAVDTQLAFPRADAREARRVEQDHVALAADVRGSEIGP